MTEPEKLMARVNQLLADKVALESKVAELVSELETLRINHDILGDALNSGAEIQKRKKGKP